MFYVRKSMLRHLKRPRKNSPYTVWIRAFGEEKSAQEWGQDPRCVHRDGNLVASRVRAGMPPERAIASPRNYWRGAGTKSDAPTSLVPQEFSDALAKLLSAHGETKTIGEWLDDDRCEWDSAMVIAKRSDAGFPGEMALSRQPKLSERPVEAFGEVKSSAEWARDPRCLYSLSDLRRRLSRGLPPEQAIGRPLAFVEAPKSKRYRLAGSILTAFGESKTLREWAFDARCRVNSDVLGQRVRGGWPLEQALSEAEE